MEKLIVVVQNIAVFRVGELALWRDAQLAAPSAVRTCIQADAELAEQQRIDLHANRRLRTPAHIYLPDTRDLRDLLRQNRVGHVEHLRLRGRIRGQRQNHNRRFGGIDLAPIRDWSADSRAIGRARR